MALRVGVRSVGVVLWSEPNDYGVGVGDVIHYPIASVVILWLDILFSISFPFFGLPKQDFPDGVLIPENKLVYILDTEVLNQPLRVRNTRNRTRPDWPK
ncbi:hypothetical protein AO1008_03898 [Aspergillus oryzae 100-8]|uniref:Uncharacterized protein n=1 Tax=Aspergillus oryzae (strain 3.042) TaxID=1160506 RepID=I8TUV6_ASPO3|nr:hypothetical protein Ao3042_05595 [Aspergillus oryzae 3.042]KDE77735.1 hypothetical protein AO1008_03898 [Aspergillus oryzae 100-8]|eukprot:EIT78175.1 hypothetical protein Ao3042_05595 [Aspergillus oryzae 3.042]